VRIRVRYYAVARDAAGKRDEVISLPEGSTVLGLVHALVMLHGRLREYVYDDKGRPMDYLMFSVNEVDIVGLEGFETVLRDGDTVRVMPPIGGG
jgi:molybdopterin synthase sulfur carrier subunit